MDELRTEGWWNRVKGALKQKWAELTDDDLTHTEGKIDEFVGRVQEKTGRTKDEIRAEIHRVNENQANNDNDVNPGNNSMPRRGF